MNKTGRFSVIIMTLLWLLFTLGASTSGAAWKQFGGGSQDGRTWAANTFDICLDAVRTGYASNIYYNVDDTEGEQPEEVVWATFSINTGFPDNTELLVPHKVHPPLQPAPLEIVPEVGDPFELAYWTILNVPFETEYAEPISFVDHEFFPSGTGSGGQVYDGSEYTMEDCFLRRGVYNGGFEVPLAANPKFPNGWNTTLLGAGDRVKCDKLKRDANGVPIKVPGKFFSFEAGIINPPDAETDPDTDPGCAFQFTGAPGKFSRLTQKRTNVEGFDSGDTVTLRAYIYGKGTNAKELVVVKTIIKYVGGGKTVIRALPEAAANINEGYTLYTDTETLTGQPANIKNILGFAGTSGRVFIDGVHMRVDNVAAELQNAEKWLPLPGAPSGK